MFKRILSIAFTLMIACLAAAAQAPKAMGKSDPEAKKVLDAVSAKFKTFKSVKASFALKIENAAGKVQGTKAGTVMMKGVKYRVSITGQEIFCDGATIWTYDMAANEVQVSALDNSSGSITPQKLFTNFYDKDFLFMLNPDVTRAGKTYQVVELTPVDKTKPFFKVVIELSGSMPLIPMSWSIVIDDLVAVSQYFNWAISLLCAEMIAFAKFLTSGLALFLSAILDISIACW